MNWSCPHCLGAIDNGRETVACTNCQTKFPVVDDIPDLRIERPAWIDFEQDRARAQIIASRIRDCGLEAAIEDVFVNSRGVTNAQAKERMRRIFASVDNYSSSFVDSIIFNDQECIALEIGCGAGQLLAASAADGKCIAGVDVSLEWLVIAKHMVLRYGGSPNLAAGLAERLPIKSGSISAVVSFDVLEHVSDRKAFVSEISRVLSPGGHYFVSTPNRFTLGPEPHVGVWGVGWLPVRLQRSWVKLISGRSYEHTRLLSTFETRHLFKSAGGLTPKIEFPPISDIEVGLFSPFKAKLARLYNRLISLKFIQALAPFFGAYYHIRGVRS